MYLNQASIYSVFIYYRLVFPNVLILYFTAVLIIYGENCCTIECVMCVYSIIIICAIIAIVFIP